MIIRSVQGSILYKSNKISFKTALEEAVERGVDLSHGDFRGQKLYQANLDGIMAPGACLWGADCRGADMAGADLRDADLRNIDFKECCLAQSDLVGANLSGSYFNNTVLRAANLEGTIFSCPSLFSCDLGEAANLHRAVYCHRGEISISLHKAPVVIHGLNRCVVIFGESVLWGSEMLQNAAANGDFAQDLSSLRATIDRFL
jgi:hypothetical protein